MLENKSSASIYPTRYETERILHEYLLFHYGEAADQLPFAWGPKDAIDFPIRCVTECLDMQSLSVDSKALDLGCAVGRSSFELAKYTRQVVGVDNSKAFILAAQEIQREGSLEYSLLEEGGLPAGRIAKRPGQVDPARIQFVCADAMEILHRPDKYDVVLAANLICRLPDPRSFLQEISSVVAQRGQLIITSPYSWLEEFTPKELWLGQNKAVASTPLEDLQDILHKNFDLCQVKDMPFLIREHYRKYQWGVSQASMWKRR